MRNFIAGIFAALVVAAGLGAMVWILVLPRLDWGARNPPGTVELELARNVLGRWIHRNAPTVTDPLAPTAENLKAARTEYEEHCAACHGLDGSGRNRFQADFYPRVAKLTRGVQKFSDAEIYFIVANGIRNTAMPAFGKAHSPDDMWRAVLWVRHLGNLTVAWLRAISSLKISGTAGSSKIACHGHSGSQAPQSIHSSGWIYVMVNASASPPLNHAGETDPLPQACLTGRETFWSEALASYSILD